MKQGLKNFGALLGRFKKRLTLFLKLPVQCNLDTIHVTK